MVLRLSEKLMDTTVHAAENLDAPAHAVVSSEFVSFAEDLNGLDKLESSSMDRQDVTKMSHDGYQSVGGIEDGSGVENNSAFSPTSLADGHLQGPVESTHFGQVSDSATTNSVEVKFNFDAALHVAFNTAASETPKQIWETGIWKHIFGDNDEELDFNVWGSQTSPSSLGVRLTGPGGACRRLQKA